MHRCAASWMVALSLAAAASELDAAAPGSPPWYVALGGSNTCGHHVNVGRTYAALVGEKLRARGLAVGVANKCAPAMGPDYASTCLEALLPAGGTRFATVEYLPNMRIRPEEQRLAFETILCALLARGTRIVIVEVSVPPIAPLRKALDLKLHEDNLAFAHRMGVPVITVSSVLHPELFRSGHLNEAGHALVAKFASRKFANPAVDRQLRGDGSSAPPPLPLPRTSCAVGEALMDHVLINSTEGFAPVDISGSAPAVAGAKPGRAPSSTFKKIAWESRSPGAQLVLCARALSTFKNGEGVILLGFQKSHRFNTPPVGIAQVRCVGCNCTLLDYHGNHSATCDATTPGAPSCTVDLLHDALTTETAFELLRATLAPGRGVAGSLAGASRAGGESCSCEVHVTGFPHASRTRVLVRALVVTSSDMAHGAARAARAAASAVEARRRLALLAMGPVLLR
ncbi:hypothetical protein T492DRAFT_960320 [Pavlovales sp. CCMP2436]|nr:hypothetical protein T492DRAFT_960320 [Pavlovales sp. CCMP2436]